MAGPPLDGQHAEILNVVRQYYLYTLTKHGPTHLGVDWESSAQQHRRFDQLLAACDPVAPFSINDYGCGYGALAGLLRMRYADFSYCGYDIVEMMIERARLLHAGMANATFTSDAGTLQPADYTVASGIFNVKFDIPGSTWQDYVFKTLDRIAALSRRAFAVNLLAAGRAPAEQRYLYYADPKFFLNACRKRYSLGVSLSHDEELGEFTISVRTGHPQEA
jgi:SAM-dependent methyltransferase